MPLVQEFHFDLPERGEQLGSGAQPKASPRSPVPKNWAASWTFTSPPCRLPKENLWKFRTFANSSPAGNQTLWERGNWGSIYMDISKQMHLWCHVASRSEPDILPKLQRQNQSRKICFGHINTHPYTTYTLNLRVPIRAAPSHPNAVITANCTAPAARAACNTTWLPLQQADFLHLQCTNIIIW